MLKLLKFTTLSKEEGGLIQRSSQICPQFYFRTTDITGIITLGEGTEMVMPGDNAEVTVELNSPNRA